MCIRDRADGVPPPWRPCVEEGRCQRRGTPVAVSYTHLDFSKDVVGYIAQQVEYWNNSKKPEEIVFERVDWIAAVSYTHLHRKIY